MNVKVEAEAEAGAEGEAEAEAEREVLAVLALSPCLSASVHDVCRVLARAGIAESFRPSLECLHLRFNSTDPDPCLILALSGFWQAGSRICQIESPSLRGWRNTVGNLIDKVWLKQNYQSYHNLLAYA